VKKKLFAMVLLTAFIAVSALQGTASAAASNYNNIIDDETFDNYSTMTASMIDDFLNTFPNSCISTNNGFSAPDPIGYNPTEKFKYSGLVSAGTVIYHTAQAYGINPRVLLATLQKEQGLVRGDGSNIVRSGPGGKDCGALAISASVGYACPDSLQLTSYSGFTLYAMNGAAVTSVNNTCVRNAAYVGFSRQVVNAAWLFTFDRHRSEGQADWYVDKPNWDNSDDANFCYSGPLTEGTYRTCPSGVTTSHDGKITIDSTTLHMDNGATAALYHFTPHKHGQDLFFDTYNAFFGSTYGVYRWTADGYQVFNQSETVRLDPGQLQPGQTYVVKVYAVNTGTASWYKTGLNPVYFATGNPDGHNSFLADSSWVAPNRTSTFMETGPIAPGQGANFKFIVKAPYKPGSYREWFKPVAEFLRWTNDGESLGIRVVSPGSYTWDNKGYRVMDQAKTQYLDPGHLDPGATYTAILTATNTGTATWYNSGPVRVNLATNNPTSHDSPFCNNTWSPCNRPTTLQEGSIAPGQTGHFEFKFTTPYTPGAHREWFKPVAEMLSWFNDSSESLGVQVNNPGTFSWSTTGYTVWNTAETVQQDPGRLTAGQRYKAHLTATNTGTATWYNSGPMPFTLAPANPAGHNSFLCDVSWLSCNRIAYLQETSIAPGQTGHFTFTFAAPTPTGPYREWFKPVAEYAQWTNDTDGESLGIVIIP
jgi:hypothetical protein